jgi:hypothetical protein
MVLSLVDPLSPYSGSAVKDAAGTSLLGQKKTKKIVFPYFVWFYLDPLRHGSE